LVKDIKSYILNKLFFPKTIVIDRPGVIISKTTKWYGRTSSQKRTVYHFEDILVDLHAKTVEELGKENTANLYYKIGKDLGLRYMLLAKINKLPTLLIPSVIDYIFINLRGAGMSAANTVSFNNKKQSLILQGRDNVICRKTHEGSINAGVVSGIFSFLIGRNVDAQTKCLNCPNNCKIVINKEIKNKYAPQRNELNIIKDYDILNFPQHGWTKKDMPSYHSFMKFKKILVDKEGKIHCYDKTIIATEIGLFGLISKHYLSIRRKDILEKGLIEGAKKLAEDILKDEKDSNKKIDLIEKILCALGWGIPHHKYTWNKIIFTFVKAPITKYDFLYFAYMLNGFLNFIFSKEYKVDKISHKTNPVILIVEYSC
jgi:hypothetical protein